jgi:hypothetical protein
MSLTDPDALLMLLLAGNVVCNAHCDLTGCLLPASADRRIDLPPRRAGQDWLLIQLLNLEGGRRNRALDGTKQVDDGENPTNGPAPSTRPSPGYRAPFHPLTVMNLSSACARF